MISHNPETENLHKKGNQRGGDKCWKVSNCQRNTILVMMMMVVVGGGVRQSTKKKRAKCFGFFLWVGWFDFGDRIDCLQTKDQKKGGRIEKTV